ncbi:MAG: hypothetical protein AAGU75_14600 [Bacillota bacterium]
MLTKSQYGEFTRNYTYDELNRLTGIEVGGETIQYTYDSVGNRRQQYKQIGDEIKNLLNYEYDIANKLLSFDNERYRCDDNGNLIEIKRGKERHRLSRKCLLS